MPLMFSESFVSNWDLSAARASSVAAALINNSAISQSRLVIAGFADSRPLKGKQNPRREVVESSNRNNCECRDKEGHHSKWMRRLRIQIAMRTANRAQKEFQCGWLLLQIWQFY